MRVCLHVLSPARTNLRALRAATALAKAGMQVTIVDIEHKNTRSAAEDHSTKFIIASDLLNTQGMDIRHVLLPDRYAQYYDPVRGLPWLMFKVIRVFYAIFAVLRTPADIYHASDLTALPACYIASLLRRKPLVFETYDMPLVSPQVTSRPVLHWSAKLLLKFMMAPSKAVISPSPPIVKELKEHFGGGTPVLLRNIPPYQKPMAVDRLREYLGLDSSMRIALYQGSLQDDRGLDALIRATKFINMDTMVVMMAKGESKAALEALIVEEGVEGRVKIIPPVPYADLLTWTSSADLGLIIYRPQSPNVHMMLPNKLFEYMMAGVPVLASPLASIVEIIEMYHVGNVVQSLEPETLGQTINAMLANSLALEEMRTNGLTATRKELRWDVESQKLIHIYEQILKAPLSS